MRVAVLTNPQSNQKALVAKLAERVEVATVVVSRNIPRKKPVLLKRIRRLSNSVAARTVGRPFFDAWNSMLRRNESEYPGFNTRRSIDVENINDISVIDEIAKCEPDLIVVSGTNIVGKRLISFSKQFGGIVNLHTGISPYVKGGPNCTNWCLAKGWFHLIGNTVMWLDEGVDSGALITTERTALNGAETLPELHWKVMEHAHEVYVKAIEHIGSGTCPASIPQSSVSGGVEFRSHEWNGREMKRALWNFDSRYRTFFESNQIDEISEVFKLFPLKRA